MPRGGIHFARHVPAVNGWEGYDDGFAAWLLALSMALILAAAGAARAQSAYPNRVIRFIVGFAAGGGNDMFARLVVNKFQQNTGATAIVENKPGAGGRISSEYVAHQPPDGYTVLVAATGQMSIAAAIYPNLTYHPTKSFIPLNMIASFPLVLVVPANHPAKTVKELVAWAKAHPDKSNYGTSAPPFTIASELLKLKTGMPGVAIPFKGTNEFESVRGQRAVPVHDFRRAAGDPAGEGRQDPRAGGDRFRALARACPMCRAWRRPASGDQYPSVERLLRAGRHAGADRRQAHDGTWPRARRSGACRKA